MLKFYYESGNDEVAVSTRKIYSKVDEYINLYKDNPEVNNKFSISQVDVINAIGCAVFDEKINWDDVCIVVEELNKQFTFDEEGVLTESWYGTVPCFDY